MDVEFMLSDSLEVSSVLNIVSNAFLTGAT